MIANIILAICSFFIGCIIGDLYSKDMKKEAVTLLILYLLASFASVIAGMEI